MSTATNSEASLTLSRTDQGRTLAVLNGSIFYGTLAVMVFTAVPYGTVEAWSESVFECAVFLLTLMWIVHGFFDGAWRVRNFQLLLPIAGLVALAIGQSIAWWQVDLAGEKVGYAISADPFESWLFALRVSALALTGAILIRFTNTSRRLGLLIHSIIAVAVGSAFFGIARQAMQHQRGFVLQYLEPNLGYAQFINRNHFAFLIEVAMGLAIGVAFLRSGRRDRFLLYGSVLLLIWAALILSNTRGGLMGATVEMIFAALLFVSVRKTSRVESDDEDRRWFRWTRSIAARVILVIVLLLVIVFGVGWLGGRQLSTGVETAADELAATDRTEFHEGGRRRDVWRATWLMFKAHPIAGAGLGGFWAEVPTHHEASGILTPQQGHNDYLELLASGGAIGAALFIWFAIALVKQARASVRTNEGFQRAASLGAIVGLVGVGVHSIVDFGLHLTVNAIVLIALLAILSLEKISRSRSRAQAHPTSAFK